MTSAEDSLNELHFLVGMGRLIVSRRLRVGTPAAGRFGSGGFVKLLPETRNALVQDVGDQVRIRRRWIRIRPGSRSFAAATFKECGERDDVEQVGIETLPWPKCLIEGTWLIAIARKQSGLERPAQELFGQQGKQECADKLAVGEPDIRLRIAPFEGEHIDENRSRTVEDDVERCRVFEIPAGIDRAVGHAEGELGGGTPLGNSPLPRVGNGLDQRMTQPELAGLHEILGAGFSNLGRDEVAAPLKFAV